MKALIVFHDDTETRHPLSRFMRKGFWHCFACVESDGVWLQLDGRAGVPVVRYLTVADGFDLAQFYRDKGCTVVETEQGKAPSLWPFALRNCVGLVKAFLCIRSAAVTPWQLYRHLTRTARMQILPGFGGGSVPTPQPIAPPPTLEDPKIAEAKDKLRSSELERKGRRAAILTSGKGVTSELGTINRPEARAAQLLGN